MLTDSGPVGFFSMAVFALTWPDEKYLPTIERHPWKSLDVVGSLLLIAAAALVTFAFQNAGVNPDQWSQAVFLAPLITGIFCWGALFAWQRYIEVHHLHIMPAFPLRLLRDHVYASATVATLFLGFPFFAVIFTFPLRLQIVNGKSGLMAGVMLLPLLAGVSLGSSLTGLVNVKHNHLFETLVIAGALMIVGCGLETTLSDSPTLEPKALGFLPFIGLGLGLGASATTILAATEAPPGEHAASQGIMAQVRVLGGSIGIAASSAILAQQEMAKLGMVITSDVPVDLTGDSPTAILVRQVFSQAFTETMRICAIVSAAAMVIACGTYTRNRRPILAVLEDRIRHDAEEQAEAEAAEAAVGAAAATVPPPATIAAQPEHEEKV